MSMMNQTAPGPTNPPAMTTLAMRTLALVYGTTAYAVFLCTFLYAIGFVSKFVVPKTIDTGPAASLPMAIVIDLVLMSVFAIQHSGMARRGFKALFARFASPAI